MANGSSLILGSNRNTASRETVLLKTGESLIFGRYENALALVSDFGPGVYISAAEYYRGSQLGAAEALKAFSPTRSVVAAGGISGVVARGRVSGVEGSSDAGVGVFGRSETGTGVHGTGGFGVVGSASADWGAGVRGSASGYYGVGVRGDSGPEGIGVYAAGVGEESVGLYAVGGKATVAGYFHGGLFVQGSFAATGVKAAAVPHPDGSYRQLYALESPECWFEDFGRAELKGGKARVELRPDFAAVIDAKAMHIFLSPEGNCHGLYVSSQSRKGFSVRELQGGASSLSFSYRIVAGRKDARGQRMERIRMPQRPAPPKDAPTPAEPEPQEVKDQSFYRDKALDARAVPEEES
jgi:hypothetical protein